MKKLVIKVSMNDHVPRFYCFGPPNPYSKALKLVGGFPGVQSVALAGDHDRIEVIGDVDAVNLTALLRKKVGFAEIVSVNENNPDETNDPQPVTWSYPHREVVYFRDPHPEPWGWPL